MSETILPPKKRDWKPGTSQVGIFLRTPQGSKIEMVANTAPPEVCACISLALEYTSLKEGSKPSHTFEEWTEIWKKRFEEREAERLAAASAPEPASPT